MSLSQTAKPPLLSIIILVATAIDSSSQPITNNVPVYLETALSTINEGSVTLKDKEGKTFDVATDSVILSVGYNPAPLAKSGKHIHVIGDAANVGNLRTVIWGAWNVCMKL